jgi:hypothetical protein
VRRIARWSRLLAPLLLLACASSTPPTQRVREGFVTTEAGVRLFYRLVGDGGPVVIFLHGGPGMGMSDGGFTVITELLGEEGRKRRRENNERRKDASDQDLLELCLEGFRLMEPLYLAHPETAAPEKGDRCSPIAAVRNRPVVLSATMASLGGYDFRPLLRTLTMPGLVIEGAETNVPLQATREWAASLPNARLLLIPDAGHMNWRDQPELFRRAADQFLPSIARRLHRFPATVRSQLIDTSEGARISWPWSSVPFIWQGPSSIARVMSARFSTLATRSTAS